MAVLASEELSEELVGFDGNSLYVTYSCSFTLRNIKYLIGGLPNLRSVGIIESCGIMLTSIQPPIDLYHHVCTTIAHHNMAIICSPAYNDKKCFRFDEYNWWIPLGVSIEEGLKVTKNNLQEINNFVNPII